jgi:hypothetical protein
MHILPFDSTYSFCRTLDVPCGEKASANSAESGSTEDDRSLSLSAGVRKRGIVGSPFWVDGSSDMGRLFPSEGTLAFIDCMLRIFERFADGDRISVFATPPIAFKPDKGVMTFCSGDIPVLIFDVGILLVAVDREGPAWREVPEAVGNVKPTAATGKPGEASRDIFDGVSGRPPFLPWELSIRDIGENAMMPCGFMTVGCRGGTIRGSLVDETTASFLMEGASFCAETLLLADSSAPRAFEGVNAEASPNASCCFRLFDEVEGKLRY